MATKPGGKDTRASQAPFTATLRVEPVSQKPSDKRRKKPQIFVLERDGAPLTTPRGKVFKSTNKRLLQHIAWELELEPSLAPSDLSLYSMFCTMRDASEVEPRLAPRKDIQMLLLKDKSLRACAGPEVSFQLDRLVAMERYFERNKLPRPLWPQTTIGPIDGERLLQTIGPKDKGLVVLTRHFQKAYSMLAPQKRAAVTQCVHVHEIFVLGILLALDCCTPEEYAQGLLALDCVHRAQWEDISVAQHKKLYEGAVADATLIQRFALCD